MKEIKRLGAAAFLHNDPANQYVILTLQDWDGGHFDLHPRMTENALILPDAQRPAYSLQLDGDPAVLKRFANSILSLVRSMEDDSSDDE